MTNQLLMALLTGRLKASGYPKLIDVTLEELETGLESGHFTSVDLVKVTVSRAARVSFELS